MASRPKTTLASALANGELENGDPNKVEAGDYLGDNNKRAYTWDAIRSEFQILEDGDSTSTSAKASGSTTAAASHRKVKAKKFP